MKTRKLETRFNQNLSPGGCGACPPTQCVLRRMMNGFPRDIRQKLSSLSILLREFAALCKNKADGGQLKIDDELGQKLSQISKAIEELKGQMQIFPELQTALVHVISKNGNEVTAHFFLQEKG